MQKNRKIDNTRIKEPIGIKDGLSIFKGDEKIGGFKVTGLDPIYIPFRVEDGDYQLYRTYDPRIDVIKNRIGDTPKFFGDTIRTEVHLKTEKYPIDKSLPDLSFYVSTIKNLEAALPYADRVYFSNMDKLDEADEICSAKGIECVALLPRFDALDTVSFKDRPVMVNNVGQYRACKGTAGGK